MKITSAFETFGYTPAPLSKWRNYMALVIIWSINLILKDNVSTGSLGIQNRNIECIKDTEKAESCSVAATRKIASRAFSNLTDMADKIVRIYWRQLLSLISCHLLIMENNKTLINENYLKT